MKPSKSRPNRASALDDLITLRGFDGIQVEQGDPIDLPLLKQLLKNTDLPSGLSRLTGLHQQVWLFDEFGDYLTDDRSMAWRSGREVPESVLRQVKQALLDETFFMLAGKPARFDRSVLFSVVQEEGDRIQKRMLDILLSAGMVASLVAVLVLNLVLWVLGVKLDLASAISYNTLAIFLACFLVILAEPWIRRRRTKKDMGGYGGVSW